MCKWLVFNALGHTHTYINMDSRLTRLYIQVLVVIYFCWNKFVQKVQTGVQPPKNALLSQNNILIIIGLGGLLGLN